MGNTVRFRERSKTNALKMQNTIYENMQQSMNQWLHQKNQATITENVASILIASALTILPLQSHRPLQSLEYNLRKYATVKESMATP